MTTSSRGFRAKQEGPHPGSRTPFDCCALSFQPFEFPVCARNADGTGTVFELTNIIPWLKEHNNTHPHTNEPLKPSDLIKLHYGKNSSGALIDPITMKPLSEHSHIVAISTTGNVFLADSVSKFAGGRDLVADVAFKKEDVITLQDPHRITTLSIAAPVINTPTTTEDAKDKGTAKPDAAKSSKSEVSTKPAKDLKEKPQVPAVLNLKAKERAYNVSPFASGYTGASLTSTSLDPMTRSDAAMFDEEELMFDDISKERSQKAQKKNLASRRAYVRMVTNLGGSLNLELFCEKACMLVSLYGHRLMDGIQAPKTCYNFIMLAKSGKYDNCPFHRLIPGFMIQGGDPTGTGTGGQSYWGTPFRDEFDMPKAEKHDSRGVLSMANKGLNSNGSQFFITFKPTPHLDGKHTVFGKLVGGEDVLDAMESVPRAPGTEKPASDIRITEVIIYQDPFEEYKARLARKLEHQSQSGDANKKRRAETLEESMTWFGQKVGEEQKGGVGQGGVGKYLKLEAPVSVAKGGGDEGKKKRKTGFGNFDNW
ncbi:peptidyl-prolyl cis-trans isomerase, cyclophilin-type protein [Rhizoctonia solani]|uniref:RING-type E3 ubiquitin transferase n=1 Tax=Rhizoctonia solani TaxID=456999 RepID=A0A8H8NUV3_9AGAM|nr:peptidyl-prolyl cis-trans isomerase, cyclophilin-type protein [Rhizoctonia solani]QRW18602.1 peptidyl-prolyl cis-trans isomerase, cyclophilin-type protein [Rhizoctonia solani]